MNKILTVAMALALTSTSAYATKARILALGEEVEDHFFHEDSRSIFTNAAYVNDYADMLTLEWGGTASASGGALDTDAAPKAMGGFLRKSGNFVYGAYLGNESNVSSFLRIISSDGNNVTFGDQNSNTINDGILLAPADNQIDLFLGSQASGLDWGVNFVYTKGENTGNGTYTSEDKAMASRFGVKAKNWDAFANISLASESTTDFVNAGLNDVKFDGKLGFQLGGSYLMGNGKFHAAFKKFDWDQSLGTTTTEGGFTRYDVGYGVTHKVNTTDMVFARAYYSKLEVELSYTGAAATLDRSYAPIIIGYEAQATSWLTLRGSITHDILNKVEEKNLAQFTVAGSGVDSEVRRLQQAAISSYGASGSDGEVSSGDTTVQAGATLTFGNLDIDGFIGLGNVATSVDKDKNTGSLNLDTALTRVGMTYKF